MIKSYKKSEIPEGAKFVEIVKITSDEVLGLVSNEDSPNTIMTTDYEVPAFILEGDIFLYADFIIQPCAAKIAPVDSPVWDDPLFKRTYCQNDLLLIRKICGALES
ncbi:hypothetical protein G5B00_10710 [Parapedobacter sp. SGR-10]|uniref:hypothetical protein n=1 Tax=Parapedobacter sp. SGR-10 TaxID=2710879 RepID=UPI0013D26C8E|nr:hypothetical protein [Parapedobacter sp. SGR-10]NGF56986.1 hypothetical protein [Parapedobacter sp. SGR-10]